MAKFPPIDFLLSKLVASKARKIQSLIFPPWMKPLCSSEVMKGIKVANFSSKSLEIILNLKLAKGIGFNVSMESALLDFGKRMMFFEFKLGNIQP